MMSVTTTMDRLGSEYLSTEKDLQSHAEDMRLFFKEFLGYMSHILAKFFMFGAFMVKF